MALLGPQFRGAYQGGSEEMSRIIPVRGGRAWLTAAVVTAGVLALAGPAVSAATAAPAPKWHVVQSVTSGAGAFTAVAATGKTTGWAFGGQFAAVADPTAWQLKNGAWTQDKQFPAERSE